MNPSYTTLAAVLVPLIGAPFIVLLDKRPNFREAATLVTGGILFLFVLSLVPHVLDGERPSFELIKIIPGISVAFEVEPLGMLFALIASGLWIVTSIYSIGYMRGHHEENQTRFYFFFAVAITAAIGVAFSANLLTLFIFYEVLTLSTFPLVTHHGTETAMRGGRVYLGILISTSIVFLLLAIVWTWNLTGTLDFAPGGILSGKASNGVILVLLALYVFGTGKAALMPFHRWLPAAMVAPTPVSALLHAVAVVKAGVFTVMKIVVYIFGIDLLASTDLSVWLIYVAAATILIASLVALTKDNLKARLAYSTVSQLSYIVLGAALANSWGIIGGSMHIATHAFGKITLFFCAGAILVASHKTEISEMKGIGRQMPFTMFAFLIGSLSIIGLPPFAGMWSKWYLIRGALEGAEATLSVASVGHYLAVVVLIISSLLNIAYLLPIVVNAFFAPEVDGEKVDEFKEAPLTCIIPLLLTAVGCIILFIYSEPLLELTLKIGGI